MMVNSRISLTYWLCMLCCVSTVFSSCDSSRKEHEIEVRKFRAQRYEYFASSPNSPVPVMEQRNFQGLVYYPFNHEAKVKFELQRNEIPDTVNFPLNDGSEKPYLKIGIAEFTYDGQPCKLSLFQESLLDPHYFIPFGDDSNGKETYGGGRFLDCAVTSKTLDFNMAYNPFCAYNPNYVCPLPPRENFIPIAIQAGEKNYH